MDLSVILLVATLIVAAFAPVRDWTVKTEWWQRRQVCKLVDASKDGHKWDSERLMEIWHDPAHRDYPRLLALMNWNLAHINAGKWRKPWVVVKARLRGFC